MLDIGQLCHEKQESVNTIIIMLTKRKDCTGPHNGLPCLSPSLSCTFIDVTVMWQVQHSTFSPQKEDIPLF
jgi:hypothetical protein